MGYTDQTEREESENLDLEIKAVDEYADVEAWAV